MSNLNRKKVPHIELKIALCVAVGQGVEQVIQ